MYAKGRYAKNGGESGGQRRAGIFIGPEFGTVSRADLRIWWPPPVKPRMLTSMH